MLNNKYIKRIYNKNIFFNMDIKSNCIENINNTSSENNNNNTNNTNNTNSDSDIVEPIVENIKKENIKKLVLSGGGLLGISYIGLFKYLEEHNINKQITSILGCSAGAIFGTFFAIGYTSLELQIIIKNTKFKDYINITGESILNFMKLKGLESGKNLINFIKQTIKDKTNNENITFKQILDTYKIDLKIGVTNLTLSEFEIFDSYKTPNLSIYQAINASIAIPFIFEPVIINKQIYCDGGVLDNLPVEHLMNIDNYITDNNKLQNNITTDTYTHKHTHVKDTLGIYLLNKFTTLNYDNYQQLSLSHYFNALMHAFCKSYISNKINTKTNHNHTIIIYEIPCDIMTFLKLSASHDDIDNIINIAYTITKDKLSI